MNHLETTNSPTLDLLHVSVNLNTYLVRKDKYCSINTQLKLMTILYSYRYGQHDPVFVACPVIGYQEER
jgi:hypothetical protein